MEYVVRDGSTEIWHLGSRFILDLNFCDYFKIKANYLRMKWKTVQRWNYSLAFFFLFEFCLVHSILTNSLHTLNIWDCPRQSNLSISRSLRNQRPRAPNIPRSHPTDRGELILCLSVWHLYSQDIFLILRTNCRTGCFGRGSGQFGVHLLLGLVQRPNAKYSIM